MARISSIVLVCALLAAPAQANGQVVQITRPLAAGTTYHVNSTDDKPDADLGTPACADALDHCTLRAAIMQANFTTGVNTITVPSGTYLLTRPGDEDGAVLGDLDVTDDLTIQGAGSSSTIVDGNGAATGDRVFQILPGAATTSISDLTIRAGHKISGTFDEGGGLYWEGSGHLRLTNVTMESNRASYGGGLTLRYSSLGASVVLDHVLLRKNAATAAAGGLEALFSEITFAHNDFVLQNSQVYSNSAYEAGGLYFQGGTDLDAVRVEDSDIFSNTASLSAGFENHGGAPAAPHAVLDSRLHDNHAGFYGGAMGNYGNLVISSTTLNTNTAGQSGGGLYNYEGGQVDIQRSTLSGNLALFGAGIYSELFVYNGSVLTLTNSTVSGNTANRDGGGLYVAGGRIQLFNATIANNHVFVPNGVFYPGEGGGLYISPTAIITAYSTLIGDNSHRYRILAPEPDDCYGAIHPFVSNLIETTTNCAFVGPAFANITGQDPLLGPLQTNGGATQTQALQAGSLAINAGQHPFCTNAAGQALTVDQRGWPRPAGSDCDIGAVEYYPVGPFLPLIRK